MEFAGRRAEAGDGGTVTLFIDDRAVAAGTWSTRFHPLLGLRRGWTSADNGASSTATSGTASRSLFTGNGEEGRLRHRAP